MKNFDLDGFYCGAEPHDLVYDGLYQMEDDIADWAEMTFTQATLESITAHLRREQRELDGATEPPMPAAKQAAAEMADCWMLLAHLRRKIDHIEADLVRRALDVDIDLVGAVREKFAAVQGRTWGKPDAEGVVEHIEDRRCRLCGCTDADCRQCVEKTGQPCYWVLDDLCSACLDEATARSKHVREGTL